MPIFEKIDPSLKKAVGGKERSTLCRYRMVLAIVVGIFTCVFGFSEILELPLLPQEEEN